MGLRKKKLDKLLDHLWERFKQEIVPLMNKANKKWSRNQAELEKGDVVIVMEGERRNQYPLGRVVEVYPGKDGISRNADVLVNGKIYRRSLLGLAVLLRKDQINEADTTEIPEIPALPYH